MFVSVFWIIILVAVVAYYQYRLRRRATAVASFLMAAERAGVTASDADRFVDEFAFWVGELPGDTETNRMVFSLYDQYRLPRPSYATIEDDLIEHMKRDLRTVQYDLRRHKKKKVAEYSLVK